MRRSFRALLSLSLLALTLASAAGASAEHRSAARSSIVCPAAGPTPCCVPVAARPSFIPCCAAAAAGPIVIPCCLSTKLNCPLLTISSSRDPSSARQAVKISGRLAAATGSVGATVTLWEELPGQTSFKSAAQTKTDAMGAYSFARGAGSVKTNRSWYATSLSLRSLTLTQMVKALVSLTTRAKKTGARVTVTFRGAVTPSHAGERVRLQERTASGWKTFASFRLTAGSTFSMRETFLGSGSALVRAALGSDSRNIASYSTSVHTKL